MVLLYNASILEIRQGNFCVINIFQFRHSITGFLLSLRDFGDFDGGGGVGEYPRSCPVTVPDMLGQ